MAFGFILFSVLFFFLSQAVVVGLAVVKIFRLWLLVLLWLKFSGYGFGVLFFVFFVRRWSLVFSLAEMFRLWFLVLFSIFLVLFPLLCQAVLFFVRLWSLVLFSIFLVLLFRFYQAIVCGLVSYILLCCCMLLCQAVVFGLVLSLLCQAVLVFGLAFLSGCGLCFGLVSD